MAKATQVIHRMEPSEEELRQRDWEEIESVLLENKEVIADTFELMKGLQDWEVFNTLNALVKEGDAVLERFMTAIDESDATQSLKNTLLGFGVLGNLNMEEIEPLILKMNTAISQVAEYEHYGKEGGGYSAFLQSMRDPEVIEGINVLMAFLKGFGANQEDREKMESREAKEQHKSERKVPGTRISRYPSSTNSKWYLAAAGVTLVALPFIFKK
ncbi:DUF1641 domain-containing protein [Natribacillus halophilus]|uniref:Uncharacterized conserved protein YjgD, DUF1641 family n=1 Tax=Natribacillus halophilus TaxID=549003 RepID=A0A1G8MWH3_9BACI|nr:DUF1641 domain-containing protein [Natribacillus halophilus]SDI71670.1 Uncharacterized conserved protein YjgD, DUF1641 family [Natribacillus halophilus]